MTDIEFIYAWVAVNVIGWVWVYFFAFDHKGTHHEE